MREIKFRGWERDSEVMVYGDELCGHAEYSCNPVKALNVILNENDDGYVYTQYTGMKDKNGREIYEGDIVEFSDIETDVINVGKVVFSFGQWTVHCLETGIGYNLYGIPDKSLRVAGNIFEGKQLSMEDICAAIKEITYDAVEELHRGYSGILSKWEFLHSLGVDVTVYDRTEINYTEFFDDSKLFLFDESITGKYNVIAQVDKDKILHITHEQKEKLKTLKG